MSFQGEGVDTVALDFLGLVDRLSIQEGKALGVERFDKAASLVLENATQRSGLSFGRLAVESRGKAFYMGKSPIDAIGYRKGGWASEKVE